MAQISVSTAQLGALGGVVRRIVGFIRRLAFVAIGGVVLIAALLARGEFSAGDTVITVLLLVSPVILLLFAQGLREVLALPERLRKMPGDGQAQLAELTRIAGEARTTRASGVPLLLWRLRGSLGSFRDVAGLALPLRVFTPSFLGLTAIATLFCVLIPGIAVIALLLIAVA